MTLQNINERNQQFWNEQSQLLLQRMADDSLATIAMNDLRSENERLVPVKARKSLEQVYADAESTRNLVRTDFSRKGGKAHKSDALQDLIQEIVHEAPDITPGQLLRELRKQNGQGVIVSIDNKSGLMAGDSQKIHFIDSDDKEKAAPVSGLKHRLFRARKV